MKLDEYKQLSIEGLLFNFEHNFHSMKQKEQDKFLFAVMDRLIQTKEMINNLKNNLGV